jgi:hypothetical protein
MAAPVLAPLVRAQAQDSWVWVPAVADINEPVVTEIEAAGGFNFSCSIFSDQEGFTQSTEKVTLPMRNCETEAFEVNGSTTVSAPDFMLAFSPQAAAGADGKKAWEAMDDYANGFLVRRQGKNSKTVVEAGDFVDVVPAQLTKKMPTKTGTGADGVYGFSVGASITGSPAWNVAVVAA